MGMRRDATLDEDSILAWAVTTNQHRQGVLKQKMCLYHNSGVGSLRSRCQQMWFLVRDNSWHGDGHFLLCPYEANGEHAAAAAKSLQSCLTLCDPIDRSSPGSSVPEILQTRILEWVAISFSASSSYQDINPIMGLYLHNLITSQRPHFQILSP